MKKILSSLAVTLLLTGAVSSCLGPNKAFNGLNEWNQEVTDQDWVNEIIFLGFTIIPVYSIFYLADIIVLNTIDYWGGDN